jgi:hypothetical protein
MTHGPWWPRIKWVQAGPARTSTHGQAGGFPNPADLAVVLPFKQVAIISAFLLAIGAALILRRLGNQEVTRVPDAAGTLHSREVVIGTSKRRQQ